MDENKNKKTQNYKLIKKRVIAGILAASITTTGIVALCRLLKEDDISDVQNQIGYTDVNPVTNWFTHKVEEDNFVIMDIGDFDNYGKFLAGRKMKYCNDHDISLGVIISTNAENEKEIYEDLDYVKSIIRDYKIDMPVFLEINDIIENDNLNNELKAKIIKDFCEKATSNGMYVGVYGKDKNLCRMKEFCDIKEYDAFLVMDSEEVAYDGSYSIIKRLDGTIESKFIVEKDGERDLSKIITSKELNNSKSFVSDKVVVISSSDDKNEEILDIALNCGMSVQELLDFNGIKKKDLIEGTELRIPTNIEVDSTKTDVPETEKISGYKVEYIQDQSDWRKGCDISTYQNDGDWDKINQNFDFVIMRSNIGTEIDSKFSEFYNKCTLQKIPLGVYCYNKIYAKDYDTVEEFEKAFTRQVNVTLETLKNKKISEPVFLDIEDENEIDKIETKLFAGPMGKECIRSMLRIWKETMLKEGYIPGLYFAGCNGKYISDCYNGSITDDYIVWVSGSNNYYNDISVNDIKPSFDFTDTYVPNAHICQPSSAVTDGGIGNGNGYLDVDFSRIRIVKEKIKSKEEQPEYSYADADDFIKKSPKLFI